MPNAGVSSTGIKELADAIDRFPKEVEEALRAIAWRTSRAVMARAKANVPVDTGYTRDNIHVIEEPDEHAFIVNAGTDRPRVRIALHRSKRSGRIHTQKVSLNMLPNWLEYGTRFMTARPFMRPAGDAENDRYKRESTAAAEAAANTLGKF